MHTISWKRQKDILGKADDTNSTRAEGRCQFLVAFPLSDLNDCQNHDDELLSHHPGIPM